MAQNYMFNQQHDVYNELEKKNIFKKNNQTKTSYSPKQKQTKLDIKNYTRTKVLSDNVTVLDFETTGGSH